jgi:2,4-dienoyl-CoA reductase-like NADH-dependent reductase (Old Yellow Enzyme family)
MTPKEIQEFVKSFVESAERARNADFDGIQIHSAHGYLLSQFLSPIFNHRKDEYGGDIRNRARIHLDVLEAVRRAVGPDYPILVKMNSQDFADNGLSLDDSLQAAILFEKGGIDAIELSGGLLINPKLNPSRMGIKTEDKEAYFKEEAKAYKQKVQVPLILVGGNRSFAVAEGLIEEGVADYISMSRPFIREPDLINRWKSGDLRKAACKSDNMCFEPARKGQGIYCLTEERERQKEET